MKKIEKVAVLLVILALVIQLISHFIDPNSAVLTPLNQIVILVFLAEMIFFLITSVYIFIKNQEGIRNKFFTLLICFLCMIAVFELIITARQQLPVPSSHIDSMGVGGNL